MSEFFSGNLLQVFLIILQIAIIFFLPQVFVILAKRNKFVKFLSPIVLCYLTGIVFSNIPFFGWNLSVSTNIYEISVPIAIALVLFSADIVKWLHLAKDTIKSFVLVIVSALVVSFVVGMVFAAKLPEGWKVAGMLTGCYTGGTPNLNAIGQSLEMTTDSIGIVNMSDMLCGGLYFILLGSVVVKLYRKILPKFDESKVMSAEDVHIPALEPIFEDGLKKGWLHIGFAFLIAVLVTGVSIGLALLITGEISMLVLILSVTTISIALSFWKKLRETKGTAAMGQYAVYIFSIAIGSTVDIELFFKSSPVFLAFTASVMFGAIILHLILCKIFKIDADTAIITSTAGVYGPAFIAPVAEAMKNRHVILSGLITGIFGYAVGTYLGVGIAYLIKSFFY